MAKKIIIGHNFTNESFSSMSMELAISLVNDGNEVIFISHSPIFTNSTRHPSGVILYSWPEKRPTGLKSIRFAISLIRQFKPDVVLAHMASVNALIFAAYLFKVPLRCAYFHTTFAQTTIDIAVRKKTFVRQIKVFRKSIIYKFCNKVFFPSHFALADFRANFQTSPSTELVINYNAINDRKPLISPPIKLRFLSEGMLTLGFLGRLDPSKGILETIEAVRKKSETEKGKIVFRIAGTGKLHKEIEAKVKEYNFIEFLGKVPYSEVDTYVASCDFLICPSRVDNLPTVCLEALMLGIPVIATDRGGLPEIIDDGVEGYLLNSLEFNEFEKVIEKIFQLDTNDYLKMSQSARDKFISRFSMPTYIASMKKNLNLTKA
jgi:glycosyltransferase involved in cell wall biosynthesis